MTNKCSRTLKAARPAPGLNKNSFSLESAFLGSMNRSQDIFFASIAQKTISAENRIIQLVRANSFIPLKGMIFCGPGSFPAQLLRFSFFCNGFNRSQAPGLEPNGSRILPLVAVSGPAGFFAGSAQNWLPSFRGDRKRLTIRSQADRQPFKCLVKSSKLPRLQLRQLQQLPGLCCLV